MPSPVTHIPDDGSGLARTLHDLTGRLTRLEAARRSAVAWTDLTTYLLNGWAPAGGTWAAPGIRRQVDGMVRLTGSLAPGTLTAGTVIAVLPAGLLPAADHEWRVPGGSATAALDLLLTAATGALSIQSTSGTVTRISLSSVQYPAA
jgi:hypothetical protein